MVAMLRGVCALALLAIVGCGAPAQRADRGGPGSDRAAGVEKTIVLGQLNAVKAYGPWDFDNTSGGGASLAEIHTLGLVTNDARGGLEPRLAARLPSLDDGSVVVLPDGRMQTTWKLRPNVKWQDGAPFTADDVVMGWQIMAHPELLSSLNREAQQIERIDTPDPLTAVITWKRTFAGALALGHRELWPYPRHLLGEAFEGDKDAFRALPYFTTDYVHLGPFRLVEYGFGEAQVFERFNDYFLGQPRVHRIEIRTIADPNVLLANLKAGAIDIIAEKTLPSDVYVQLRDEFRQTGGGTLVERQDNWRYLWFQFDPEWARPLELSRNAQIRRALLYGMDRDALREFLLPGFSDTSGDTFMLSSDARGAAVGQPFARYPYDPARAARELADAGWRRGADGRLLNAAGEQVQIELRGSQTDSKEVALVADQWRQLGIDMSEVIATPALGRDNEYKSKFPGLETRARGTGEQIFVSFDGRLHSRAENRWQGSNTSHYANPVLDRLIDRVYAALDEREQASILREMGELMATDLPALPMYFRTTFSAVARGVRALTDDYPGTRGPASGPGLMSRNAHLWERD